MLTKVGNQVLRLQSSRVRDSLPMKLADVVLILLLYYSGGLLVEKTLENDALNYQPGSRWDPERSTLAAWLRPRYGALFPVFREIKTSLVGELFTL